MTQPKAGEHFDEDAGYLMQGQQSRQIERKLCVIFIDTESKQVNVYLRAGSQQLMGSF